jgi:carboxynorspermidine decarboxylase
VKRPAYIYDLDFLTKNALSLREILEKNNCRFLYPLKPCSLQVVLKTLEPLVDGFEVSSLFEARLASSISRKPIHYTSPGLCVEELPELVELCAAISCNSLTQLKMATGICPVEKLALRINPQLSFVKDERYDPCHSFSKLGVPLSNLVNALKEDEQLAESFSGITFHTVCEEEGFMPLEKTIDALIPLFDEFGEHWQWISFGGGYLFEKEEEYGILAAQCQRVQEYGLKVFMEPGAVTVSESASLAVEVIDIFSSSGQEIAVLNSSVNHLPEAFEYNYKYPMTEESENGQHQYILAGNTCLAGDVFGRFTFDEPLRIGDFLNFQDCGAYALVKAHMFNGVNLPVIYTKSEGKLSLIKEFNYRDFLGRF